MDDETRDIEDDEVDAPAPDLHEDEDEDIVEESDDE